jgi:hypothetical protein
LGPKSTLESKSGATSSVLSRGGVEIATCLKSQLWQLIPNLKIDSQIKKVMLPVAPILFFELKLQLN